MKLRSEEGVDRIRLARVQEREERIRKWLLGIGNEVQREVQKVWEEEKERVQQVVEERDKLLRRHLGAFNDYVNIMEMDKEKEILDMRKLRSEMRLSRELNARRVMKIDQAISNTDILLADKYAFENLTSSNHTPLNYYSTTDTVTNNTYSNPYKATRNEFVRDDSFIDNKMKEETNRLDSLYANNSMVNLGGERKYKVKKILDEIDSLLGDPNSWNYY